MSRLILMLSLLLASMSSNATSINELLGTVPGERSEIKGKSVGGTFEILRIPTVSNQLKKVYPDLEVMISRESRKVVGIGSMRAYSTVSECKQAKDQVQSLLNQVFPDSYKGNDPRWQYQSSDGNITAGAMCSGSHPYPVLRLDVTHTSTNNEILMHFK
jgi:hypothetical protein